MRRALPESLRQLWLRDLSLWRRNAVDEAMREPTQPKAWNADGAATVDVEAAIAWSLRHKLVFGQAVDETSSQRPWTGSEEASLCRLLDACRRIMDRPVELRSERDLLLIVRVRVLLVGQVESFLRCFAVLFKLAGFPFSPHGFLVSLGGGEQGQGSGAGRQNVSC